MDLERKKLQGVLNIVRFNWHFYLLAGLILVGLFFLGYLLTPQIQTITFWLAYISIASIFSSLVISYYIYDLSALYQLKWLPNLAEKKVLNISAGFDETSTLLQNKTASIKLSVADFYDPARHKEVSIQRARKVYPPSTKTIQVSTESLPFENNSFDYSLAILSAHEIRNENERIGFFKELARITKPNQQIFVTEHLRDFNNFLAYTIGFFHFHSKTTWFRTFEAANLKVTQELKTTPFITTFILEHDGTSS